MSETELVEVMARRKIEDSGREIKIKTEIEKNIVEGEIFMVCRQGKASLPINSE